MKRKFVLIAFIVLLFFSIIFGKQFPFKNRSFIELWNLGHIFLFFCITFFLFNYGPFKNGEKKFINDFYIIIIISAIGFIIELIQYFYDIGTPDYRDLYKDYLGAALGYLLTTKYEKSNYYKFSKYIVFLLVLYEFVPFIKSISDEINSNLQFPLIADFESQLELGRLSGDEIFMISSLYHSKGVSSLKVIFDTTKYSTISFDHFPQDWTSYKYLKFDVFNPSTNDINLTCRINDKEHEKSNNFNDRFNKKCILISGWNEIVISLKEVEKSPISRTMDMMCIANVKIFTINLAAKKTVFIDYLRLE